jgi:uncharacterized membrane protein YcaP (DUF421 family)
MLANSPVMDVLESLSSALGLDLPGDQLNTWQMLLRAAIVYVVTLLLLKIGKKRLMGQHSALDVVMIIVLGSVISRGINGAAPFWPTMAASAALIAVHRIMSWAVARRKSFARFVEGGSSILVSKGKIDWQEMRKHDITERDLYVALRTLIHSNELADAKDIYLEPNGKLSIVKPEDGVQSE